MDKQKKKVVSVIFARRRTLDAKAWQKFTVILSLSIVWIFSAAASYERCGGMGNQKADNVVF